MVAFFTGSLLSKNYVVDEITSVSLFKEYGKACIYGDESFFEATQHIIKKIKNGPKSLD